MGSEDRSAARGASRTAGSDEARSDVSGKARFPARYVDLGPVARGGWGEVRRVRDTVVDRIAVAKILAWEHLESELVRARFTNEARITASLDHPGVVPILDSGELEDGRPWFAMKEVQGRTFQDILAEPVDPAEASMRLRRLVEILVRVAETVGYAHERGIVHRDLKPGNIMVGRFGEVLVLDWGVARVLADTVDAVASRSSPESPGTEAGEVLGTMAYMAPEQARGARDEVGPASDVYALGVILHEILTGRRVRDGSRIAMWAAAARGEVPDIDAGPQDLRSLAARATRARATERPASAIAFANALRDWLDGAARLQRAEAAVARAMSVVAEIDAARAERDAILQRALLAKVDVRDHDPVERKAPIWDLEDRAADLELRIATLEQTHIEWLRSALEHDAEFVPAHAELARTYRLRMVDAEKSGSRLDTARYELLLRRHDRGEHASFLRGHGRVIFDTDPPGADVVVHRFVLRQRRLVTEEVGSIGRAPIDVELPAGSYLFELTRPGREPVRYPVLVERDRVWDATRPGSAAPTPVWMPDALGPDDVYVPAGWTLVGHDAHAAQPVPSRRVWIDGFVIRRYPVTCREYLAYLDDLVHRGALDTALAHAPSLPRAAGPPTSAVVRLGGRFAMAPDDDGREVDLECPMASIDWHAATAFARWEGARLGVPWRLPNELEREKAGRGTDGRAFAWGAQNEPTWACVLGTRASSVDPPRRQPVSTHATDESPYGVRGLSGNVRDWCANVWRPEGPVDDDAVLRCVEETPEGDQLMSIRGGAWSSVVELARLAGRFAAEPSERFPVLGLRLCRSVDRVG